MDFIRHPVPDLLQSCGVHAPGLLLMYSMSLIGALSVRFDAATLLFCAGAYPAAVH